MECVRVSTQPWCILRLHFVISVVGLRHDITDSTTVCRCVLVVILVQHQCEKYVLCVAFVLVIVFICHGSTEQHIALIFFILAYGV